MGVIGLQIVIYIATVLFSACVTNNAAVTIMFPIAYVNILTIPPAITTNMSARGLQIIAKTMLSFAGEKWLQGSAYRCLVCPSGLGRYQAAENVGADFRMYMYLIMMGASASFMTPTGYQTNLMVYTPGGYKFMDFVKFGGVLQIYLGVVTIIVLQTLEFWLLWVSIMWPYCSTAMVAPANELSGRCVCVWGGEWGRGPSICQHMRCMHVLYLVKSTSGPWVSHMHGHKDNMIAVIGAQSLGGACAIAVVLIGSVMCCSTESRATRSTTASSIFA